MTPDQHIYELRKSGRFTFCYFINEDEKALPKDELRAKLKIHFEKCVQSFFDGQPKAKDCRRELEHY